MGRKQNKEEGRKQKRRREIKIGRLRKWRRDGCAIRAVCEHALVSGNEHGPAFVDLRATVAGYWKEQRLAEKHCLISSQKCHLEGETGRVLRDSWEWRDQGVIKSHV